MVFDFKDFYIAFKGHPRFNNIQLIEDDLIRVIVQKWEMIVFTNKGDLFFDPDFGGDLYVYLHETRLSADFIENSLRGQIDKYITELESLTYTLKVDIYEDPERFQEYMEIYFEISDYQIYAAIY